MLDYFCGEEPRGTEAMAANIIHCTPETLPAQRFDAHGVRIDQRVIHAADDDGFALVSEPQDPDAPRPLYSTTWECKDARAKVEENVSGWPVVTTARYSERDVCIVWHTDGKNLGRDEADFAAAGL